MTHPREDSNVIVYTPHENESIENIASEVVQMMGAMEMDAEIHFDKFTIEVDQGTSAYDIIKTFKDIQNEMRKHPEKFDNQEPPKPPKPPTNNNGSFGGPVF